MTTYALTGATGKLGAHAIAALVGLVGAQSVVALARDPAKLADWAAKGVTVRAADFDQPETLRAALAGVDRLLLISGNATGQRERQHGAVIDAARAAGVKLIVYTSIIHAPTNPIKLAGEHRATEALLAEARVPHVIVRNGWYAENYTGQAAQALAIGKLYGSAGQGRISGATRADLGEGAARVLVEARGGEVYEFAADEAFTLAELAAEAARLSGKPLDYVDLPQPEYADALRAAGLPGYIADMASDSSYQASNDALFEDGRQLSRVLGRPTTNWRQAVADALG